MGRVGCDGLGPPPEGRVGGRALGQHCAPFHISWALNSAHGPTKIHWILALIWEPVMGDFSIMFPTTGLVQEASLSPRAGISALLGDSFCLISCVDYMQGG